jgi:hypothetical protein
MISSIPTPPFCIKIFVKRRGVFNKQGISYDSTPDGPDFAGICGEMFVIMTALTIK